MTETKRVRRRVNIRGRKARSRVRKWSTGERRGVREVSAGDGGAQVTASCLSREKNRRQES